MSEQTVVTPVRRRWFSFWGACLLLGVVAVAAPAVASTDGQALAGQQLKSFISGKRIYLAVPFGGEIPLTYRANGVVDGSGESAGLGKYMAPTDKGRWWVSGSKLCQQWQEWYKGRTFCFTVAKLSQNRIRWVRDDGKSGVARVR